MTISPFANVPDDLLPPLMCYLTPQNIGSFATHSKEFYERVMPIIVSNDAVMSHICTELLTYQDEKIVTHCLHFFAKQKPRKPLFLDLRMDFGKTCYFTSALLVKITKLFGPIRSITETATGDEQKLPWVQPKLPPGIKQLTTKIDILSIFADMSPQLNELERLHLNGPSGTQQMSQVLRVRYSKAFTWLRMDCFASGSEILFSWWGTSQPLTPFIRANHLLGRSQETEVEQLARKCLEDLPDFLPAKLLLASLHKDSESREFLEHAIKTRPGEIYPEFLYALQSEEPIYLERVIERATREKNIPLLLHIAQIKKRTELAAVAFDLLDPRVLHLKVFEEYLKKIVVIDPTHILARIALIIGVQNNPPSLEKLADDCIAQNHLAALILLRLRYPGCNPYFDSQNPLTAEKLREIDQAIQKHSGLEVDTRIEEYTLAKVISFFNSRKIPVDHIVHLWIKYFHSQSQGLYKRCLWLAELQVSQEIKEELKRIAPKPSISGYRHEYFDSFDKNYISSLFDKLEKLCVEGLPIPKSELREVIYQTAKLLQTFNYGWSDSERALWKRQLSRKLLEMSIETLTRCNLLPELRKYILETMLERDECKDDAKLKAQLAKLQ